MAVLIQLRRGTESEWTTHNPILAPGEMGVETDTGKFKVGNGTADWNVLPYSSGDDGANGVDGSVWFQDARAPSEGDGQDGDIFLRTDTGDIYYKSSGSWGVVMNIQGNAWYTGFGIPAVELGQEGDFYLDSENGDVYERETESWTQVMNIMGPSGGDGVDGEVGPAGEDGEDGKDGESAMNSLYVLSSQTGTVEIDFARVGAQMIEQGDGAITLTLAPVAKFRYEGWNGHQFKIGLFHDMTWDFGTVNQFPSLVDHVFPN